MRNAAVAARHSFSYILTIAAVGLVATYLTLMVSTIVFAAVRTDLAGNVSDRSAEIARLEAAYYDAIELASASDPSTLGFTAPARVSYVTEAGALGLTFAQ